MIVLPEEWKQYWNIQEKGLQDILNIQGEAFRQKDGRRTIRFKFRNNSFFGKFHSGVGWKKIIKNILQFRMPPVLSAENEWLAILKLRKLKIDTMELVGYGKTGWNPAGIKSFVITKELKNTISLEDYCQNWSVSPPDAALKQALIIKVAQIAKTIHENGINHKDLYICHFLLDISNGINNIDLENIRLFLIDLHRVQIRAKISFRWRVKDVAAILFSSMDADLTRKDMLLFAKIYFNTTTRKAISENKFFWWLVKRRAIGLYKKQFNKKPPNLDKLYG